MLTDSGTNAMSDEQVSKMFVADDAYAGSQSFVKFQKSVEVVFGKKLILPVHQGVQQRILFHRLSSEKVQ